MRVRALVRHPDGTLHELLPGDIIGRMREAGLHIDDARVSEAHALVSLRGDQLKLLALRGAFAVDGRPLRELVLRPGLRIQLARGLHIEIEELALPDSVLGLEGEDFPLEAVPAVASLIEGSPPHLTPKYVVGAAAHLWSTGGPRWSLRVGEAAPVEARPGLEFEACGRRFRLSAVPLAHAAGDSTHMADGIEAPLCIVTHFDTVHIHRDGRSLCALSGVQARIVSELAATRTGLRWTELAGELWPDESEPALLRPRLDVNLSRLRRKLREAGIRTDLIRADGAGMIELLLLPQDQIEDRS